VDHAIAEVGSAHLARLRERDDEEDRAAGLPGAADQVLIELVEVFLEPLLEAQRVSVVRLCSRQSK
jgi:hypothetical protein